MGNPTQKRYPVRLSGQERARLERLASGEGSVARAQVAARARLMADAGHSDAAFASELGLAPITLWRLRKRVATEGVGAALARRPPRRARPRVLDDEGEARLRELAGGPPPPGRARWTLTLLAERLVELGVVERVCYETIRPALKREPRATTRPRPSAR